MLKSEQLLNSLMGTLFPRFVTVMKIQGGPLKGCYPTTSLHGVTVQKT